MAGITLTRSFGYLTETGAIAKILNAMATKSDSLIVSEITQITGRGTAVLFRDDPPPMLHLGRTRVKVITPNGEQFETTAFMEAARKLPADEVLAMLFPDLTPSSISQGSKVQILEPSQ